MSKVSTYYKGDCQLETVMGNHKLIVDMPESMGGKNRGPMPPQLFAASLGSCVGVLITDFCHKHNLNPDGLEVHATYEMANHPIRISQIKVDIKLPHVTCDDECTKKAIMHVAEHCPVHETICSMEDIELNIHVGNE